MARRCVTSLGVTSTMRARPRGSRCVRPRSDMGAECRPLPRTATRVERHRPPQGAVGGLVRETLSMDSALIVGEAVEDWTGDARYFEYTRAASPVGSGHIPKLPMEHFPAERHRAVT